uniref:Uncharacterized protein n=1 Tax=viral metagenome TaxID=1070528 RepID=A0A6C0JEK2_9ZZZZ
MYNYLFYKKNDLCVIEDWNKDVHGSSGEKQFDNFLKAKKLVYTSVNDEYDINSYPNNIDFIENWSYMIQNIFPTHLTKPYIALADVYIFNNYCFAIDKTKYIIKIQLIWKKYYKNLIKKINIAKKPNSIIYRELYGKYPDK